MAEDIDDADAIIAKHRARAAEIKAAAEAKPPEADVIEFPKGKKEKRKYRKLKPDPEAAKAARDARVAKIFPSAALAGQEKPSPAAHLKPRVSSYTPEIAEQIASMGDDGESLAEIATAVGTTSTTLYRWRQLHPDLDQALNVARAKSLSWWNKTGRTAMLMPGFNATVFIYMTKNLFPDDFRDVKKIEASQEVNVRVQSETDTTDLARRLLYFLDKAEPKALEAEATPVLPSPAKPEA